MRRIPREKLTGLHLRAYLQEYDAKKVRPVVAKVFRFNVCPVLVQYGERERDMLHTAVGDILVTFKAFFLNSLASLGCTDSYRKGDI